MRVLLLAVLLGVLTLSACGKKGAPSPPGPAGPGHLAAGLPDALTPPGPLTLVQPGRATAGRASVSVKSLPLNNSGRSRTFAKA